MNMMISYQELVRTFLSNIISKFINIRVRDDRKWRNIHINVTFQILQDGNRQVNYLKFGYVSVSFLSNIFMTGDKR